MTASVRKKAEAALARVAASARDTHAIFVELSPERILAEAERIDERHAAGERLPLHGTLVSLKDLVDEAGQRTTAGSRLLAEREPAGGDAEIVRRLKAAGALPFGRTSMSEFAYSGVGLNPHHGTPGNVFDEARVPGGSSSGGALSVALGFCDVAIGTDTGGSVRIPAAANGLVGLKPTQASVPRDGVHALSDTFDSVGPLAADLRGALRCHEVLCDVPTGHFTDAPLPERPLRLALPRGAFVDGLDASVAASFEDTIGKLREAGHRFETIDLSGIAEAASAVRVIVSSEALLQYGDDLETLERIGDPHVLARIRAAESFSDNDVVEARALQRRAIDTFTGALDGFDALLAPTVAIETPTIARAERDFDTVNPLMLRNTTLINLTYGCALTLPVARENAAPAALMLAGPGGADAAVLAAGRMIERSLGGVSNASSSASPDG